MKMIGSLICWALSLAWRSSPDMPGIWMSVIRHAHSRGPNSRNSSADAKARVAKPSAFSSPCRASRMRSSSSTIATTLESRSCMLQYQPGGARRTIIHWYDGACLGSRPSAAGPLERFRHPDQLGKRRRLHLPHHTAAVDLDCDLARPEAGCDQLVRHT